MGIKKADSEIHRRPVVVAWAAFVLVVAVGMVAHLAPPKWALVLVALFLVLFVGTVGYALTERCMGVMINHHKIMSVSRFQMVLWTVLIVTSYFVIAVARVKGGAPNPLAVEIGWQLWALMGISAAAAVGSPIAASAKASREPADGVAAEAGLVYKEDAAKVNSNRVGVLYPNQDIGEARFADMFEGEELGNAHLVDMPKVQMFFFTVVVALAYAGQVLDMVSGTQVAGKGVLAAKCALPPVHQGLVALMGISNSTYLGGKAVTQTATKPPTP